MTVKRNLSLALPIVLAVLVLVFLMLFSSAAVAGASSGVSLCLNVIVPSLLPFFVLSYLLSELGLPRLLGRFAAPMMAKLFRVSGSGAAAFILGLSGGYPLGAATVCDLYTRGEVKKKEAQRLLGFCNNSGPAFVLGAAGAGIFRSTAVGLGLYLTHALAAVLVGVLLRGRAKNSVSAASIEFAAGSFSQGFPRAIKRAVSACAVICGFVVFFSALNGILTAAGFFTAVSGSLAARTGLEMTWIRSLLIGVLELSSGIGSLAGVPASPMNLALAAFILGFGGLSVHCQTLALTTAAGLSCTRHFFSRILHGLVSAAIVLLGCLLMNAF